MLADQNLNPFARVATLRGLNRRFTDIRQWATDSYERCRRSAICPDDVVQIFEQTPLPDRVRAVISAATVRSYNDIQIDWMPPGGSRAQYECAEEFWSERYTQNPNDPRISYLLGSVRDRLGNAAKAVQLLRAAQKEFDEEPSAWGAMRHRCRGMLALALLALGERHGIDGADAARAELHEALSRSSGEVIQVLAVEVQSEFDAADSPTQPRNPASRGDDAEESP